MIRSSRATIVYCSCACEAVGFGCSITFDHLHIFSLYFSMGCYVYDYMHTPALNVPPSTAPVRQWGFGIFRCYLSSPPLRTTN